MQNLSVCQLRTSNNMHVLDCGTKPEYLPRYAKYTQAGCETVMLFLGSNSADHPTFVLCPVSVWKHHLSRHTLTSVSWVDHI